MRWPFNERHDLLDVTTRKAQVHAQEGTRLSDICSAVAMNYAVD